jgi:hypothetical protein
MSEIAKLPAAATPPPALPSGTFVLYPNGNWTDQNHLSIVTANYAAGVRHSIANTPLNDAASWVAFNLPLGQVVTLAEHVPAPAPGISVGELSTFGRCIDLVGTGQTESVDLSRVNMNDCASAFFWRYVDLSQGALEIYDDANFGGNRNVIFLSEWPANTTISIADWWLNDRVTSLRWTTLPESRVVIVAEHRDGSGRAFGTQAGTAGNQIPDMGGLHFNDAISSFRWEPFNRSALPHVDPNSILDMNQDAIGNALREQFGSGASVPPPVVGGGFKQ